MVKRLAAVFLLATLLAVTFGLGNAAEAGDPEDADLKKILELIAQQRDADHIKLSQNDKLSIPNDLKDGIAYRLEHTDTDPKTGKSATVVDGVARFYPPVTDAHKFKAVHDDNGLAVYNGGSYHLAVDASQYGFSAYIAILDATAPTAYEFDYELPDGFKLSEDGNGGISILNGNNELIGVILAPWAYDANGAAVPTEFKLGNGSLIQAVAHAGAAYPVVADPRFHVGYAIARNWMHSVEKRWCDGSPANRRICVEAYGVHGVITTGIAIQIWGATGSHNYIDAFRHCLWSARMFISMNSRDAQFILDLHEREPGQSAAAYRMDVRNNAVGRNLARTTSSYRRAKLTCQDWAANPLGPLQLSFSDESRFLPY